MNILAEIRSRFRPVLADLVGDCDDLLAMVRPAQDPKFGDYQANFAMPLKNRLGQPPREIASDIVQRVELADICQPPEVAGPGFINLRLRDDWLAGQLQSCVNDERVGAAPAAEPRTYVIDYSSPNVAKEMHVGHIRSTVIGDSLARTLRFLGHRVISDNHLGDWGTQFGMIIYGYKHFRDDAAYDRAPVKELARLYKLVNRLVEYHEAKAKIPELERQLAAREEHLAEQAAAAEGQGGQKDKKAAKALKKAHSQLDDQRKQLESLRKKAADIEANEQLSQLAQQHADIGAAVLAETVRLHEGDAENRRLWEEFLPACRADIQRIYDRLDVAFDEELGESFYQDKLAAVVEDLQQKGLARESDGAMCVFLEGYEAPMIVRKRDGAFLYATTDLATIAYRIQRWRPDAILYVVDFRQGEHFEKLFAAARLWGYDDVELRHIAFGTVLGEDGRPYKTRSGDTVGLEGLLDEAVSRAYRVVTEIDQDKPTGPELSEEQRRKIAEVVGPSAIKYADLSQNRTSDYVFSYDKMLSLRGNTATYMQYAYARVQSILARGNVNVEELRRSGAAVTIEDPAERALALAILRLPEALSEVIDDYRPNQLTNYLFEEVAKRFSTFFENCPVLKAESDELRASRLLLCDLTARVVKLGLSLLGIGVVEKM